MDTFLSNVNDFASMIFSFLESLNYELAFGDYLLSFLIECVYAFSVAFVFVLPFLIVWLVIKSIIS